MSENIQLFYRHILSRLPATTEHHLVMLTGARQTGKTTAAKQRYPSLRYFNLDAVEYRRQLAGISSFSWGKTVGNAILDEAQKEPSIFEKVKFAFDEKAISFSVLLGSAQLLLLKKIRETLAGRVFIYELWPLLFSELVSGETKPPHVPLVAKMLQTGEVENLCKSEPPKILGPQAEHLYSHENYLCQWGGMPGLLHLNDELRWQWLKSYEQSYLERDLEDIVRIHDLEPFRTFHRLAALRSGSLLSFSELARDAALSVETARRYIEYLKISYQAFLLQPFSRNLTSTLVKTPKLYWSDMGLWRQLTGNREGLSGQAFENYIVSEILKLAKSLDLKAEFSFYRTRSGMEIDLLCKTSKGVLGIEIKSRDTIVSSDYSNLRSIATVLGKEWLGGLVIYRGDEIRNLTESIWAMPSTRLLS